MNLVNMDPLLSAKVPRALGSYGSGNIGQRHVLMVLVFVGCLFMYASRIALSISMVAMTMPIVRNISMAQNGSLEDTCPDPRVPSLRMTGANSLNDSIAAANLTSAYVLPVREKFDWDAETQGILHGSFFYGYLISQVPGGWLARRYGAKLPFGVCMLISGVLTILSPLAANAGVWVFFVVRILIGICQGIIWPTIAALWSQWAPPLERGRLLSLSYSGTQLGTVFGMYVAGVLAQNHGWPAIFYCFGALCLGWVVLWTFLAHNTPNRHPRISTDEREYINFSIHPGKASSSRRKQTVPWVAICTSAPVCAMLIVEVCHNYAFYVIISNLPTYLNNVHHFSLKSNGLLSAMPYLTRWIVTLVSVSTADWILTRKLCSATVLRKILTLCAYIGCGCSLLGVAFSGCNSTLVVALFTVGVGFSGMVYAGNLVAYSEMSPNYASILMGMGNTAGTISGIVAPYVTGVLTNGVNGNSVASWQTVFVISAGVYAVASIVYGIFGTAKRQIWD